MKKFVVRQSYENFKFIGDDRYQYQCLADGIKDDIYFENEENAIEFMNNYKFDYHKDNMIHGDYYFETLDLFEFFEDNNEIGDDVIYSNSFDKNSLDTNYEFIF